MQERRTPGRPGTPRSRVTPTRGAVPSRAGSSRTGSTRTGSTRAGSGRVPDQGHPGAGLRRDVTEANRPASRPASARRSGGTGAAKRTRAPQPHRLTGRATVLACVLGALLLAYAYPVRVYLNQQAEIAGMQAAQAVQRQRIKSLGDESAKWNDPEYIAAQARSRLQMVKPGEVAYLIIDTDTPPPPTTDPNAGRAKNTGPWYEQVWSSVQAADKPRAHP